MNKRERMVLTLGHLDAAKTSLERALHKAEFSEEAKEIMGERIKSLEFALITLKDVSNDMYQVLEFDEI